ncbi:MAG: flavodoxin domain-containing protein [Desulfarculaceae bacterium]|jgi:menaquinone-dependent protoporphyrinogen oxidase
MQTTNRRQFIKKGVRLAGGALVAASSPGPWAPALANAGTITFPESECVPDQDQKGRILVAYASMHGTTGSVAQAIAKQICAQGFKAEVRLLSKIKDLSPYQGFVIGSAIRSNRWLPEAEEFVAAHRRVLSRHSTAYFLTCLTLAEPGPVPRKMARAFLDPVLNRVPEVSPTAMGLFGGVLDYSLMGIGMGVVMRYKMWAKDVEQGDYRDWDAIKAWSQNLSFQAKNLFPKEKQS